MFDRILSTPAPEVYFLLSWCMLCYMPFGLKNYENYWLSSSIKIITIKKLLNVNYKKKLKRNISRHKAVVLITEFQQFSSQPHTVFSPWIVYCFWLENLNNYAYPCFILCTPGSTQRSSSLQIQPSRSCWCGFIIHTIWCHSFVWY